MTVNAVPTFTGTASCSGGLNTGSISQTATGGTSPYSYAITGGSFGATLANSSYTITVTDANTCTSTATITVACTPVLALSVTDPCNCTNGLDLDNNGTKEYAREVITIQPGTAPYSVTAISGLFSSTGVALTTATATALITGPDGSGNYTITAYLPADGTSTYSLTVQDSASLTDTATGGPCAPCSINCAASSNMQWIH